MKGFPQVSANPNKVKPISFGCVFGVVPDQNDAVMACAYAIDPSKPRVMRRWPEKTGDALQMCDWRGGLIDAEPLKDFVVFGGNAQGWIEDVIGSKVNNLHQLSLYFAEAGMDYLSLKYGAPVGEFATLTWMVEGEDLSGVLTQSCIAKRLILAQWEEDQLSEVVSEVVGGDVKNGRVISKGLRV